MVFTTTITQNKEFLFLYKKGKSIISKAVVVYFKKNNSPYNRLGITSSKKIGNAVARNRARRVIRAAYRLTEMDFPIGYDMIFVARTAATGVKSDTIKRFFSGKVIPQIIQASKK
ncbi:MAG: ribonuclease P protein component [Oscillospiraceae bacterium]